MTNPFDFVNDLSYGKKDIIRNSENPEQTEKEYNGYMVNKAFSYFIDTVLHANEINMASHIDNIMQHDYYKHALRAKKRFSKWHKNVTDNDIELIATTYNINIQKAKEYASLLSPNDMDTIKTRTKVGGKNDK